MKSILAILLLAAGLAAQAQSQSQSQPVKFVEIRSYTLKPGTRDAFDKIVKEESLPMLKRWNITVLGYGPSLQEDSSYYLIRGYPGLEERQKTEDAFYASDEWKKGPREAIVSKILYYTTVILPVDSLINLGDRLKKLSVRQ